MSNNVSRSYPKDNKDTSLREETLCPCPPENSEHIPDTDKAELDGGIPFLTTSDRHTLNAILFDALDDLDYIEYHTKDEKYVIDAVKKIRRVMNNIDPTFIKKAGGIPFQSISLEPSA